MRPVARNNPAHYVLNPNTLITIPDASAQNTLSANGCNKVNGNQYPFGQIQSFMARMVVIANTPGGGFNNKRKKTMNYLTDYIFISGTNGNFSYKDAKLDLINGLGQFCNYCGVRINDYSLAVEHCLPKSQFSDEMMNYNNFLLACPECNSSNKKANPTYANGVAWSGQNLSYLLVKQFAVNRYTWPTYIIMDATPPPPPIPAAFVPWWGNFQNAYGGFIAQYWSNYNNGPIVLWPFANQINVNGAITNVNNNLTGTANGLVSGQVCFPPLPPTPPINSQFGVKYDYAPFQPPMYMVQLVGLNNYAPNNLHASDRRVFNRTLVWFHACTAFKQFDLILRLNLPQQDIDDLMDNALNQMYSTASEIGFWEVWADLLLKQGGGAVNNRLYQEFKAATINNNIYFPGTNPGPPANPYIP